MDNSRPELNSQVLRASGQCHAKHLFLFAEQLYRGTGLALLHRPQAASASGARVGVDSGNTGHSRSPSTFSTVRLVARMWSLAAACSR